MYEPGSIRDWIVLTLILVRRALARRELPYDNNSRRSFFNERSQAMAQFESTAALTLPVTKVPALDTVDRFAVSHSDAFHACSEVVELPCSSATPLPAEIILAYADFILQFTGLDEAAFVLTKRSASPQQPLTTSAIHASQQQSHESEAGTVSPNTTWSEYCDYTGTKDDIHFILQLDESENDTREPESPEEEVSLIIKKLLQVEGLTFR